MKPRTTRTRKIHLWFLWLLLFKLQLDVIYWTIGIPNLVYYTVDTVWLVGFVIISYKIMVDGDKRQNNENQKNQETDFSR